MPLQPIWTLRRASGVGLVAGLISLVLWPAFATVGDVLRTPFLAALAVTALCGVSILLLTAVDLAKRRRGKLVRPIRVFDAAWGAILFVPSFAELIALLEW